jgi:NAD/NADP transhydrogenase alpha subunit
MKANLEDPMPSLTKAIAEHSILANTNRGDQVGSSPDVVVRIAHTFDNAMGNVSYMANGFRALTGLNAFRAYDWMTDTAALNVAGNFRGMVVSARWASAYTVLSSVANKIGNVATVASIAANVIDLAPKFEQVYNSKDSAAVKAQKYSLLTSIAAQKTLAGIVTSGVHLIYLPLIAGCGAAAKAGGGGAITSAADVCSVVVQNADALVQTSANYLTDPANQQKVLLNLVTIRID